MANLIPERFLFRYSIPIHKLNRKPNIKTKLVSLSDNYLLPSFSELERKEDYATLKAGWHAEGLLFEVTVNKPDASMKFVPDEPEESDGLWLWIDTRNTQSIHRASRFCQSFFFYPNRKGDQAGNLPMMIPRAREETPLPQPESQTVLAEHTKEGYRMQCWIPAESLNGFDPANFSEIGFSYCVQDFQMGDQVLAVEREFPVGHDPSLWSTLNLVD